MTPFIRPPKVVNPFLRPVTSCVTAAPTNNDDVLKPTVEIPLNVWSDLASIVATLIPFAQLPGVLAAKVTPVIVFSS